MQTTTEKLFKELQRYPRRLTRKEKQKFRYFLKEKLENLGYDPREQKSKGFIKSVNIETHCNAPLYLVAAHYDTPTVMPPWLDGLFRLFGHTRQILIFVIMMAVGALLNLAGVTGEVILAVLFASLATLIIPNPHNANDNTSGVLGCLRLAESIADDTILKDQVKFVFFDHEEWGLLGSSAFVRYKNSMSIATNHLKVITLDCIGRGDIPMVIRNGKSAYAGALYEHLKQFNEQTQEMNSGIIPLSDNYSFKNQGAVNVSVFKRSWIPGGYVIENVHLPADKKIDFSRVDQVVNGVLSFIKNEKQV